MFVLFMIYTRWPYFRCTQGQKCFPVARHGCGVWLYLALNFVAGSKVAEVKPDHLESILSLAQRFEDHPLEFVARGLDAHLYVCRRCGFTGVDVVAIDQQAAR